MRMIGFWQRALCVLMVALPMLASAQTAPVTVFAAASLKEAMDEAAAAYEKQPAHRCGCRMQRALRWHARSNKAHRRTCSFRRPGVDG